MERGLKEARLALRSTKVKNTNRALQGEAAGSTYDDVHGEDHQQNVEQEAKNPFYPKGPIYKDALLFQE